MEKQAECSFERPQLPRQRRNPGTPFRIMLFIVAGALVYYSLTVQGTWFPLRSGKPQADGPMDFSWDHIEAKPQLDYEPCYQMFGHFQCARLELPMDYFNDTTDAKVNIAIIKKPAAVPVTHAKYGGAVIHNPGGPGGSGVGFLLGAGAELQDLVGDPDGLQFDHISFDPRGIGFSVPRVECFKNSNYQLFWLGRTIEEGLYSSSDAAFGRLWSMATAEAGSCSFPPEHGEADIKKYVNTAFAATDMLEIVERHGEWREAEARRLLQTGCKGQMAGDDPAGVLEKLKYRSGEEKINYWGFSYGTYLGNTFAAMYPDRVNRLIVDGVVDAYDYRKTLWLDNLVDTEADLDLLYFHCARVGHPKCALANATGETTVERVRARVQNITMSLYHNPLPVISRGQPSIITYSDIKGLLFASLYSPIELFPVAAQVLARIEEGGFGIERRPNANEWVIAALAQGATMAIACSDGESLDHVTREDFREHVKKLEKLSPNLGEIWAVLRLSCIHYKVRAHYRFTADWVGNTSHPIMEIGNTADPVTPGRYAKKMAKGFEGAVALIQDSPGHCSLSAPSNCTATYIRQYFQTGALPEKGTVCSVDEMPFGKSHGEDEVFDLRTEKLSKQIGVVRKALRDTSGGFGSVHELLGGW